MTAKAQQDVLLGCQYVFFLCLGARFPLGWVHFVRMYYIVDGGLLHIIKLTNSLHPMIAVADTGLSHVVYSACPAGRM